MINRIKTFLGHTYTTLDMSVLFLESMHRWWKHTYKTMKLSYARDRLVENYFWTCGVFHEAKYSRARMMFAKTAGLLSTMDDTYDVHATLEECCQLNEAIQRYT